MFKKMGIDKPATFKEWLGLMPLALIFLIGGILITSFPICILGVSLQVLGEYISCPALISAGTIIVTIFGHVTAIFSGTLGQL